MSDDGKKATDTRLVLHEQRLEDENEGPVFKIVRGPLGLLNDNVGVRPCDHHSFILDDKWNTVTCSECKAKVDPYSALRAYASWYEKLQRKRENAEHAEWSLLAKSIREMLKRRCFTDEERETMKRQTHLYGLGSLKGIRTLHEEVTERVRLSKRENRQQRKSGARR